LQNVIIIGKSVKDAEKCFRPDERRLHKCIKKTAKMKKIAKLGHFG
jgi:hypothetical protein